MGGRAKGSRGRPGDGEGMRMTVKPLTTAQLYDLHSVLRRAAERAEQNNRLRDAEQLARAVKELNDELLGRLADAMGENV